jgi:two-component sensor histidine kinase
MECSDTEKVLSITDDGVGIPEDFDPFQHPSLGMNIVYRVVIDQLRGTIELIRGEGTTWVLKFPVTETIGG